MTNLKTNNGPSTQVYRFTVQEVSGLSQQARRERLLVDLLSAGLFTAEAGEALYGMRSRVTGDDRAALVAVAGVCLWAGGDWERGIDVVLNRGTKGSTLATLVGSALIHRVPCDVFIRILSGAAGDRIRAAHPQPILTHHQEHTPG